MEDLFYRVVYLFFSSMLHQCLDIMTENHPGHACIPQLIKQANESCVSNSNASCTHTCMQLLPLPDLIVRVMYEKEGNQHAEPSNSVKLPALGVSIPCMQAPAPR